ncbi:indole-3-glycerol phosphate synthase TrpC [Pedobacter changchengzhani]|uniref:Indole-3-glycerol phosphate synthase n=1 Tax=Pedobacter changchengzhani TaxID=2529274 RepID=A0A4R5MPJ0_9SPHI|nr:indole-3-glycerol phosphate synthase TrpC [Pedobacter changchengzhani]TDG37770.1 indole-3-glycerol phosphate synthase TrpC [Pedobacter changchengzhani]
MNDRNSSPPLGADGSILDRIVLRKMQEVAEAKQLVSIQDLEDEAYFKRTPLSFKEFLLAEDRTGIIAEFKRRSPSKGLINGVADVAEVTQAYNNAGASALSVLTDVDFFGGKRDDLLMARKENDIPILRKDFIIDEYQILEAKAWGADIILLIASILTPQQIIDFGKFAQNLGLNVLLEVHNLAELERSICPNLNAIGVNNRNLADFTVDIQTSFDLVNKIPNEFLKISESAISDPKIIKELKIAGFNGFLIGENFMKTDDPGKAIKEFVAEM